MAPHPTIEEVPIPRCTGCNRPLREDRDRLDLGLCYYCGATPAKTEVQ